MKTSESIDKIAPAILKAQRAITFAVKDSVNPHFRNKYADLSSVIEAVKPALNDAGISFLQMPVPSEDGILAMATMLLHESGQWFESTATCPLQKNDPQGYGSACTYLRRYSLAAAVGLYQDDDDGNAASKPTKAPTAAPKHRPTDGVTVDPARESALLDTVEAIKEAFERDSIIDAYGYATEVTDSEEKVFIWGKLPANIRSAIKKHGETLKKDEK